MPPAAAIDILLNFPSLDIVGEKKATKNSANAAWKFSNFGHSNILAVNHMNTDSVVSYVRFGKKFRG